MTQVTDEMVEAFYNTHWNSLLADPKHELKSSIRVALAAALAAMWRPIEEYGAEKHGEYILVWQPNTLAPNQTVVRFDPEWGGNGWWMACDGKNYELPLRGKPPTHFQPLPSPPKETRT